MLCSAKVGHFVLVSWTTNYIVSREGCTDTYISADNYLVLEADNQYIDWCTVSQY